MAISAAACSRPSPHRDTIITATAKAESSFAGTRRSGQVNYWDSDNPGFGLRVSAGGRKTWIAMYRHGNMKRRLTIGTYPPQGRILEKDVLPRFGKRKAKDITRRDIIALLDDIVARGAPIQANPALEIVRKLFN